MNEEHEYTPLVIVDDMAILPGVVIHFDIKEKYNINAVKKAIASGGNVVVTYRRNGNEPTCGVAAHVRQIMKSSGIIVRALFVMENRILIDGINYDNKTYMCTVSPFEDKDDIDAHEEAGMMRTLLDVYGVFVNENGGSSGELEEKLDNISSLKDLIDFVTMHIPISVTVKQKILEESSVSRRYEFLVKNISDEISIQRYRREYASKVKDVIEDNQREYYLREQLRAIHKELGDDDVAGDTDEFMQACEKLNADESIKEKLRSEIRRFKMVSAVSSESAVIRAYIETILGLPWNNKSEDNNDIHNVKDVLDKNHYGLDKVKERIVESLAVRTLTDNSKAPILCLVGPPGTGKTSIVKSVADALGRKYDRICLGGVRDEAEIRGHRKTYVGAMPGRLVKSLEKVKVSNPVMLLDEIDKVSTDYKGDTHSALLEVLDPEQNKYFTDHYVELPVDLSDVLFVCTANTTETIPQPLIDRMEIVEIAGYTENERFHIAKEHLIDKQRKQNGLKKSEFAINDDALGIIIGNYTREAGVRNLERVIGKLCRKVARQIVDGEKKRVTITGKNIETYLGKEKYSRNMANASDEIGIVRGLAWTKSGGDTLEIEVNIMKGKGELELTGQLGDVMKESARTALSYVRAECDSLDMEEDFFKNHDIHVHVPEGAVPKDGPSAGITMATAIMSAVAGKKVRADIAMTGEITLRGRVLPIGGLKEKLLAAKTSGIYDVLVPEKNRKDIEEIENEIKDGMNIIYVNSMEQVLSNAFAKEGKA